MHNFKKLNVWKRGVKFAVDIYKNTEDFPSQEKYGLTSQIRRSAVSLPSNVAEGCGRKTNKDFSNFLSISLGSQFELETQLILAKELGMLEPVKFESLNNELEEIQKMTRTLIDKLS